MKTELFISSEDFEDLIEISSHCNYDKLRDFILTTQDTVLHDALGGGFYYDLLQNHCTAEYKPLMNGASYEGCSGETLYHKGLKLALAYLSYAHKVRAGDATDTPFGVRKKLNTDSVPLTDGEIKNQFIHYNRIGMAHLSRTLDYLCRNKETFTEFKGQCQEVVKSSNFGDSEVISNNIHNTVKKDCDDC